MTPFYEETIHVNIGEGYLIAPVETLEHIANVYRTLAEESDEPAPWNSVAQLVEDWTSEKGFYPEDYDEDPEEYKAVEEDEE